MNQYTFIKEDIKVKAPFDFEIKTPFDSAQGDKRWAQEDADNAQGDIGHAERSRTINQSRNLEWLLRTLLFLFFMGNISFVTSQSLLDMVESESAQNTNPIYVDATFKSTRLINGQTIETTGKKGLNFIISHRFGNISSGSYDFYGLDQSFIRLGLEYGLTDRIDLGLGRGNEQKLADGYVKIKLLRQAEKDLKRAVTVCWYSAVSYTDQKWENPLRENLFSSRLFYVHQILVARKISSKLSVQMGPGVVHRNLVEKKSDANSVAFVNLSGRMKLTNRISLNAEYFYLIPGQIETKYKHPFALGVDIETGGHVFQLHLSNSRGRTEKGIAENLNRWSEGEVGFGFNIIRHFNLEKKR
jgi:hypothetical protein